MARVLDVLVLDDEPIVTSRVKPTLEKAGYNVEALTDSKMAMERIKKKRFDIIITDFKMKQFSGLDLLVLQKKLWPDTEVIIITGYATMETAKKTLQSGGYDFISKPFRLNELRDVVNQAALKLKDTL